MGWFWKEPLVSTRRSDPYALITFWRKTIVFQTPAKFQLLACWYWQCIWCTSKRLWAGRYQTRMWVNRNHQWILNFYSTSHPLYRFSKTLYPARRKRALLNGVLYTAYKSNISYCTVVTLGPVLLRKYNCTPENCLP